MKRLTDKELVTALINCSGSFVYCNDCPAFEICGCDTVAPPMELLREAANRLEARPVKNGHWISFLDGDHIMPERYYKCSCCGRVERKEQPYCHCGAKMYR